MKEIILKCKYECAIRHPEDKKPSCYVGNPHIHVKLENKNYVIQGAYGPRSEAGRLVNPDLTPRIVIFEDPDQE